MNEPAVSPRLAADGDDWDTARRYRVLKRGKDEIPDDPDVGELVVMVALIDTLGTLAAGLADNLEDRNDLDWYLLQLKHDLRGLVWVLGQAESVIAGSIVGEISLDAETYPDRLRHIADVWDALSETVRN